MRDPDHTAVSFCLPVDECRPHTRFVPHSVMIGLLSGAAVNILLGQLPNLFGISASGPYPPARVWDLLGSLDEAARAWSADIEQDSADE